MANATWGFVKVLYAYDFPLARGATTRGILSYGGGTYWPRNYDSINDATQTNADYDEYDDGETITYQVAQAVAAGQEPILYLNCLVPSSLRASGSTLGWGDMSSAAPDMSNHTVVANAYAAIVNAFVAQGVTKVVIGGELRGMYSTDPGNTGGSGWDIPRYWDLYEKAYDAIKAVQPTVRVYGPYCVFYDGTEDGVPNTTIGTAVVATEALDAMIDFLDLAIPAGKLDGVAFDAVLPTAQWPDMIGWVRARAGARPLFVAECYTSYTAPPTGPLGTEITTGLLSTIDGELAEGDGAMFWGEPPFWNDAELDVPQDDVATPDAPFTVEDGTGLEEANTYCTVAFADAYHLQYGNPSAWSTLTTAEKQDALRQATRIADDRYAHRWTGVRGSSEQALDWPRAYGTDSAGNEIDSATLPTKLKQWTARAALDHANGSLVASEEEPSIVSESFSSASGASKSVTYTSPKRQDTAFVVLDRMLVSSGLISGGGPNVRISR